VRILLHDEYHVKNINIKYLQVRGKQFSIGRAKSNKEAASVGETAVACIPDVTATN